ncbi:MAG: hypothetical protein H0U49_10670 [Parachlamydiaceae bacterium]|nr:hypothetical protein [Parachlamydiaceae bacterium]
MNIEPSVAKNQQPFISTRDAIPPLAAASAVFPLPICYGLATKSAWQLGIGLPSVRKVFLNSFKIAPALGVIVGIQMFAKRAFENSSKEYFEQKGTSSYIFEFISSSVGAIASIYPLAGINAMFGGKSFFKSMKNLTLKQAGATFVRETTFVLSLSLSEPLMEKMKSIYGDNQKVEYASAAASGAFGSICGHPFDTILTCEQEGKKVVSFKHLSRGLFPRAISIATFAMCYHYMQKMLKEKIIPTKE